MTKHINLQKNYSLNQGGYQLKLPLNIETIIPEDDSVRLPSQFVEKMDLTNLYSIYERINLVSPRTLLKIVLYSYMNGGYSSRSMELNCKSLLRSTERNSLHASPIPISEMTKADAVIITHLHIDHFDEEAKQQLPKNIPVYIQNQADKNALLSVAFQNVQILGNDTMFGTIRLIKTNGQHGYESEIVMALGDVCGVIMQHEQEKTVYIAGDTVWYDEVDKVISDYQPPVIIVNAEANSAMDKQLIMGKEDVLKVHNAAPFARIIATHMESINHWVLSRSELRAFAEQYEFTKQLFIPNDGETLKF